MEDEYYIDLVMETFAAVFGWSWRIYSAALVDIIHDGIIWYANLYIKQASQKRPRVCIRRVMSEDHSDDASYILSMIIAVLHSKRALGKRF